MRAAQVAAGAKLLASKQAVPVLMPYSFANWLDQAFGLAFFLGAAVGRFARGVAWLLLLVCGGGGGAVLS